MPDHEPAPENVNRKSAGAIIAVVAVLLFIVLPVLYILSVGPVFANEERFPPAIREVADAVYFPLAWIYDTCPETRPVFSFYFSLWGVNVPAK